MNEPPFYVTGGTVPPDSPSYVARAADAELFAALQRREFCYVLNARQMGKSSLCVRTRQALEAVGTKTVFLDLQSFSSSATAEQWYRALLERIGNDLKLRAPFLAYWRDNAEMPPLVRLFGALRELALAQIPGNIVVFIDEIDLTRKFSFETDEFFLAIREMHNARAADPAVSRLTFCLVGLAPPTELIRDVQLSPFNVGTRIRLHDLTRFEALPLAKPLPGAVKTLDRVLWWTNGHPYLTQRLCAELAREQSVDVDAMVARLFFAKSGAMADENVKNVPRAMLSMGGEQAGFDRTDLLMRYERIVAGKRVLDNDIDPVCTALALSGLVTSVGSCLRVRNRVYARLFGAAWVRENLPDAEVRRQHAALARGRWQVGSIAAGVVSAMACLVLFSFLSAQAARRETKVADHLAYISAIYLAGQNVAAGNYGLGEQFFGDAGRFPQSEHGFEWEYLLARLHPELACLEGHKSGVSSVAISPDGTRVLTGSKDTTASIWDAKTGKILITLAGHSEPVTSVAFSPDGRRAMTGSADATARIWDVRTGDTLRRLAGHTGAVNAVAFSPNGTRVVTASYDATARICDARTGKLLRTLKATTGSVTSVAFSPDGKELATGCDDRTARVWNVASGRLLASFTGHTDAVTSVAFSPSGKLLATGGADKTARIWEIATGRPLGTVMRPTGAVSSVAFSPDGVRIVAGINDGTAVVWDVAAFKTIHTFTGHSGAVTSVAYSKDGTRVVTGSDDATARVWGFDRGVHPAALQGHTGAVSSIAISADGRRIVTGSWDGTARLWNVNTGKTVRTLHGNKGAVYTVAFSPDGRRIVTGSVESTVDLWDAASGALIRTFIGHRGAVYSAAFSPDGKHIATGSADTTVGVWNVDTGDDAPLEDHARAVSSVAFSPDGQRIAAGSFDNTTIIWDQRYLRLHTLHDHTDVVRSVAFSPDSKRLVTASDDGTARVWDVDTGRDIVALKGHTGAVSSAAFSPDGARIVTGSDDTSARVWDAETGRELIKLDGHTGAVTSVAFSTDGKEIVTGSRDGTARIWQAAPENPRETAERDDARISRTHRSGGLGAEFQNAEMKYIIVRQNRWHNGIQQ